jgi:hypothetical protein
MPEIPEDIWFHVVSFIPKLPLRNMLAVNHVKIDASVTMMQVEEKPDVTYSDVGEKLREVVETPLLSVRKELIPFLLCKHVFPLSSLSVS